MKAVGWISGATYAIYQSNFFHVIFTHPFVNPFVVFVIFLELWNPEKPCRVFFKLALISFGVSMALLLYMSFYLPYVARIQTDPEEYSPAAVPITTLGIILCFLTSIMAFWPVWGWYTFPLIVVIATGLYDVHHFLPGNFVGMVLQLAVGVFAVMSPQWISHAGKWHF